MANIYNEDDQKPPKGCGKSSVPSLCADLKAKQKAKKEPRPREKTVLKLPAPCCDQGSDPKVTTQSQTPSTLTSDDDCLQVIPDGPNSWRISFRDCALTNYTFTACGIDIQNGLVQSFQNPILKLASPNNTINISGGGLPDGNCKVDLDINLQALNVLPTRVICEEGPCDEAGKGIAVLQVVQQSPTQFVVEGCSLAGQGATNSTLSFNAGPFSTLAAAVAAMNAATLAVTFGSCGGGGGGGGGP